MHSLKASSHAQPSHLTQQNQDGKSWSGYVRYQGEAAGACITSCRPETFVVLSKFLAKDPKISRQQPCLMLPAERAHDVTIHEPNGA